MMARAAPAGELQRMLHELATVRPHLAARRADRQSERLQPNRTYHYAVDTNILYFIAWPVTKVLSELDIREDARERGGGADGSPRIGSIFSTDPRLYHLLIGTSLADYIGSGLTGLSPLMLPVALWPEVENMLAKAMAMGDPQTRELDGSLFDEMRRLVDEWLATFALTPAQHDEAVAALRSLVQQQIGLYEGLQRLQRMLNGGRIDELAARPIQALPHQSRNLADWQQEQRDLESRLINDWDKALEAAGKDDASIRGLDARALTQVQLRNQFAQTQSSNERVIYVTADSHVLMAARTIPVEGSTQNFAEAYVRHPMAFLNEIDVGASGEQPARDPEEPTSILDWIDVLLAESSDLKLTPDPDAAEQIRTGWRELVAIQEKELLHKLGFSKIKNMLRLAQTPPGDGSSLVTWLHDKAWEGEARAWRNCFDIAIEITLRRGTNDRRRAARSSPPIVFEAWPDAGAAVEQFKLWGSGEQPTKDDYLAVRGRVDKGEDSSGYAFYLASAAFFAARGDWEPAAGLAAFSRTVAGRLNVDEARGANGREASYFEAVARRHLARSAADLARPIELLGQCWQIYWTEAAAWRGPMGIVTERFDLEGLDIEQTRLLFAWDRGELLDGTGPTILKLLDRYEALRGERLAPQVDVLRAQTVPPPLGSEGAGLVQCEVRTIISALMLLTIDAFAPKDFPTKTVDTMLERLDLLRGGSPWQLLPQLPAQDNSYFARIAVAVAGALRDEARQRPPTRSALREVETLLEKERPRERMLYPYDKRRLQKINNILNRSINR